MTSSTERKSFDEILEQELARLPEDVRALLDDVPLIVEDEPSRAILDELGIQARTGEADLCGIHSGIALSQRSVFEPFEMPTRICLFRNPILRLAGWEPSELKRQIRITLLHEIGHLFGFDEDELREMGYE
jgi:predicted Zn-dependent protease with MMP-like domain